METIALSDAANGRIQCHQSDDVERRWGVEYLVDGPANVSISSVQASDLFLKLNGIKGAGPGRKHEPDQITLSGGLSVTTTAAQDMVGNFGLLQFWED